MSKLIKIPDTEITKISQELIETLRKMKMSCGKLSFTKDFGKVERRADLIFTEKAWLKQEMLVREFDKEVAWHGIAYRGDDPEKDEYYIEDIIVYPQEVSGATVTTDQEEYQNWLMSHEDEIFNNIRMQGHSHVNMSTSPSGVDETLYESILGQLEDSMFYIFLIWNKRDQRTIRIYDLKKNILFETSDIDIYTEGGYNLDEFLAEAKEVVKTKTYTNYNYGNSPYYGGYSNTVTKAAGVTTPATQKEPTKPVAPVTPAKAAATTPTTEKKGKKKKDKKKETSKYGSGYDDYGYHRYGADYSYRDYYNDYQ